MITLTVSPFWTSLVVKAKRAVSSSTTTHRSMAPTGMFFKSITPVILSAASWLSAVSGVIKSPPMLMVPLSIATSIKPNSFNVSGRFSLSIMPSSFAVLNVLSAVSGLIVISPRRIIPVSEISASLIPYAANVSGLLIIWSQRTLSDGVIGFILWEPSTILLSDKSI